MLGSSKFRHHHIISVATATLLSLGLLSACGAGSSHSAAPRSGASPTAPSHATSAHGPSSDAGAKSGSSSSLETEVKDDKGPVSLSASQINFALHIAGRRAEKLANVGGFTMEQDHVTYYMNARGEIAYKKIPGQRTSGHTSITRGAHKSKLFNKLISGRNKPASASIYVLDDSGRVTFRYFMKNPKVIKVELVHDSQVVIIHFTNFAVG